MDFDKSRHICKFINLLKFAKENKHVKNNECTMIYDFFEKVFAC